MRTTLLSIACLAACSGSPKPVAPPPPPPPPAPACESLHVSIAGTATAADPVTLMIGDHSASAVDDAQAAAAHGAIAACNDDHWSASAIACFAGAKTDDDQVACAAALPADFSASLRAHVDREVAALPNAVILRGKPRPWQDMPTDTGVPECDAYLRAFNAYMRCDKIPEGSRQAAVNGAQEMAAGFARLKDPSVSAAQRKDAGQTCAAGIEQLRENAAAMGCTVP